MKKTWIGRRTLTSLVGPVTFLGAVGLWIWLARWDGVAGLLGAAVLILTAILGIVRLFRTRAARRFNAAVDAYVEREIDRERLRDVLQTVRDLATRGGALSGGSTHERYVERASSPR
jgi:hypothetical protein